ncbi:M3 family oligoendopeptidase [Alicyclobacillaceae bacterium I2511]|nr:M3 family oligoendopeptidase [Alicyclobacillaceae bacterium I2511]
MKGNPSLVPTTWNLDSIFSGGSRSTQFAKFLTRWERDAQVLAEQIAMYLQPQGSQDFAQLWLDAQQLAARQREAGAFVSCLGAQNTKDIAVKPLRTRVAQNSAMLATLMTDLEAGLAAMSEATWQRLFDNPQLKEIRFSLEERRAWMQDRLPADLEKLNVDLAVDGYHAWGQLYDTLVGRMTVPVEENGQVHRVSPGQAANFLTVPDHKQRVKAFYNWEQSWSEVADLCAESLNHLAGYRLALYRQRGWTTVLHEPLRVNRMKAETLDTLWGVVADHKGVFVEYLQRKARLFNVERLDWSDVGAPLADMGKTFTFEQARDFIVSQFSHFSAPMADFANQCFEQRWIEAENRPNKRPGGFCTTFPLREQSRIFVTFSGSPGNVATLAHELGHAYHQHVMHGLPQFASNYAMNVAETASTFAEMIVANAALGQAANTKERLVLLEDKVQHSVTMFMNIHARFLFETRFYEARKQGWVGVQELNHLMAEAQKEAFVDSLASYHPYFWASKLHFYSTGVPFYNFPYTFGYLFSTGLYVRFLEQGPGFADRYVNLLRDTGSMTVENLALTHLGVDLTKPVFWEQAMEYLVSDATRFLQETEQWTSWQE